ncbi:hypothetical protein PQX77_016321, partial [Marasmius sp. AFHP31]
KTFQQSFKPRIVPEYYEIQKAASASLIGSLRLSPEAFFKHIEHFAGSIVLDIAYGYKLQEDNDPYVRLARDASEGMKQTAVPAAFLMEYLPWMRLIPEWLPGGSFKAKARVWAKYSDDLVKRPWEWLIDSRAKGTAELSFANRCIEDFNIIHPGPEEDISQMEEVVQNCAAVTYQAGSETTVSALLSFVLAMTLHPDIQKAAQKEIQAHVGTSRLPDFEDRESLPLVSAILSEVLRWNPVTPLGVPHRSMDDDVYEGYFIPKDSTIVPNIWSIMHDKELFGENTREFDPSRFLQRGDKVLLPDPANITFGFGRRICPGRHLAMNSLWIAMAHLLATYTIARPLDEDGNEIDPQVRYTPGLVSAPEPFRCRFINRL